LTDPYKRRKFGHMKKKHSDVYAYGSDHKKRQQDGGHMWPRREASEDCNLDLGLPSSGAMRQ
jgi:hypothetical protein